MSESIKTCYSCYISEKKQANITEKTATEMTSMVT